MALRFLDSFDHYVTADLLEKYTGLVGNTHTINTTGGRRSGGAFTVGQTGSYLLRALSPAPDATIIAGFAYKVANLTGGVLNLFEVRLGGTVQVSLGLLNTGILRVCRGDITGTLLGVASAPLPAAVFVFIELRVAVHASAGTVSLRINEADVLTLTGVNTSASGTAAWDTFALGNNGNTSLQLEYFDDLYILDGTGAPPHNAFLGDVRVDARYPTAEGATAAWTPLSGTDNALMVDETAPDDDTTYNSTTTVGATDTLVVADAPVPGAVLLGVQLVTSLKKSDAGTCSVAPVVRHSGVDYLGTASNPGVTYAYALAPYGLNPGTGAPWTEAEFNAAEFGYRRTA